MNPYPHIRQQEERDCGAACLSMIAEYYGLKISISTIREYIKMDTYGSNIYGLIQGAEKMHLSGTALEGSREELLEGINDRTVNVPFIARIVNNEMFEHYIVVYNINESNTIIGDPAENKNTKIQTDLFFDHWLGQLIIFAPTELFKKGNKRKGTLSRYIKTITSQKKKMAFILLISILVATVNIVGSVMFEYLVDDVATEYGVEEDSEDTESEAEHEETNLSSFFNSLGINSVSGICIMILIIYAVLMLAQFIRNIVLTYLVRHVDYSISSSFFDKLFSLPQEFFERFKTGALLSRFADVSNIRDAVSGATLTVLLDTLIAFITGIYLFVLNFRLFLISLAAIGAYAVIMLLFRNPIRIINQAVMEQDAVITSSLKEKIDGMETIKAYNEEHIYVQNTKKLYNVFLQRKTRASILSALLDTLAGFVNSSGILLLIWAGVMMCINGKITLGILFSFYYLLGYFYDPVQNLIDLLPSIQSALVAAERLNDVMDASEEENCSECETAFDFTNNIKFQDVSFRYGYRKRILDSVSLIIPKGKKIALTGASGSGKTTIAKLLIKLYLPEEGSIFMDGININDLENSGLRDKIVYVPQYASLFSESIRDNLCAGRKTVPDEDITEVCEKCLASEFINELPFGIDTILEENGKNLSGGQRQRLALARALLKNPQILILDEATSSLEEEAEAVILDRIFHDKNLTCVIITHRRIVQDYCDMTYHVEDGKVTLLES